jgi:phosphoglycerol transferase
MSEIFKHDLFVETQQSLSLAKTDKLIPIALGGFCFLLAWYLMGSFNLHYPISYRGDTFFMSWMIKRLIDGFWIFNSVYSGFPFGSAFYDFPTSDSGSLIIFKLLGSFTHNYILTLNIYFLLGFSVTSTISYVVLKKLGCSKIFSLTGAILFTFLPFHLFRLEHLFYTWYFNIPIFIWLAFKIFSIHSLFYELKQKAWERIKLCLCLLFLASFGVYNAFFAALMFVASGIAGSLKWNSTKNIISAFIAIFILTMGVGLNIAPNFIYSYKHGSNPLAINRSAMESECYGLKLVQMLLPQAWHRSAHLRKISAEYNQTFPLVTENITASLGLIGSLGLIILLSIAIGTPFFRFNVDTRIQLLAFLTMFLFIFATIGGFSSIFSLCVSPMIRAWNRVSVFIGFAAIAAFMLCAEKFLKKITHKKFLKQAELYAGIFFITFGIWDQTYKAPKSDYNILKIQFLSDKHFIQKIEKLIPGGAVYQLPYIGFPEETINNNFYSYDIFRGYLHSTTLHWSSGGTKGRPGDLFFRNLASQPMRQQIEMIKKLGFNGIYIDRRGYSDQGIVIEKEIAKNLDHAVNIVSEDKNLLFFYVSN